MITSHEDLKVKPSWRFLFSHPAHMLSFGLGLGLVPRSPGTAGTLLAFPFFWYMSSHLSDAMFIFALIWMYFIGVWVCDITGKALGEADFGGIVWDEVVAFLLVLFFTPDGLIWQLLAFSLFRFFDIVKPQPIRYYDSHWHGGHGVMFDDLLAAGYTLFCLAIIKSILI